MGIGIVVSIIIIVIVCMITLYVSYLLGIALTIVALIGIVTYFIRLVTVN